MNALLITLDDAQVREAIALYVQKTHPEHQTANIELGYEKVTKSGKVLWQGYVEHGEAVASIELLPKLEAIENV